LLIAIGRVHTGEIDAQSGLDQFQADRLAIDHRHRSIRGMSPLQEEGGGSDWRSEDLREQCMEGRVGEVIDAAIQRCPFHCAVVAM
jgi:hypothetical protein